MDDDKKKCCGCCSVLITFISVILLASSFATLDVNTAGIKYNTISVNVDTTKVYTAGRYYVGLGMSFKEYDLTHQNVEFSSSVNRDAPSLDITLSSGGKVIIDCSFQYQLNVGQLQSTYQKYELNYQDKFVKIGTQAIKGAARSIPLNNFYNNRKAVQATILAALKASFAQDFVTVHGFQLRKVDLPSATDGQIESTLVTQEEQRTALKVQQSRTIQADSLVIEADAQARINKLNANATSTANVLVNVAESIATAIRLKSEGSAYDNIATALQLTKDELLKYIWLVNLKNVKEDTTLAAGFNSPLIQS